MNGNCHFVYGAAVGTALALNLDSISNALPNITDTPETITLFVLGGLIGGILPDIDNPTSYVGKLTVPVSKMFALSARGGKRSSMGKATGKTGKNHRGIMHDPIVYIAGLILSYFYFTPLVGLFIGCLSHLVLDMFNPSGIPFLFGAAQLHLGKIPSGSKSSVAFTWVSVGLVLVLSVVVKVGILSSLSTVP